MFYIHFTNLKGNFLSFNKNIQGIIIHLKLWINFYLFNLLLIIIKNIYNYLKF